MYLEPSIHEVVPPNPEAIFHPKVWLIRYRSQDGQPAYRLLCLSRNLTFDRSWDTVLVLEGEVRTPRSGDRGLPQFVDAAVDLAIREIDPARVAAIHELASDLRSVVFTPPEGFDRVDFWPIGLRPNIWPFSGRVDRLLVVSPFLTASCLARLNSDGALDVLVSRPEALDLVGGDALVGVEETLVLSPSAKEPSLRDAAGETASVDSAAAVDEAVAEAAGSELSGLHAKLYVAEAQRRSRVWTGSANATSAAFGGNVEFLVELEGSRSRCGIDAVLGDRKEGVGLRKLLEPYRPSDAASRKLTPAELLDRRLEELRRAVARQAFTADVEQVEPDLFALRLQIRSARSGGDDLTSLLVATEPRLRPLTLGAAYLRPPVVRGSIAEVDFGTVSYERLTSFFVVEIEAGQADHRATVAFVVNAAPVGFPSDRRQRTLLSILRNRRDFVRFLLLLLGGVGGDDLAHAIDVTTGDAAPQSGGWVSAQSDALLEPMVRALSSEPRRLDEIRRLIIDLDQSEAGRGRLPPGWREVWEPIWQAREALRTS